MGSVRWTAADGWAGELPDLDGPATLVLVLLAPETDLSLVPLAEVSAAYPTSLVTGCSTAGVADGATLLDDGLLLLVCAFERTRLLLRSAPQTAARSHAVGRALAGGLHADAAAAGTDLRAVLVICDGMDVVGNAFAEGVSLGAAGATVFGGMSALMPGPGGTIRAPWTVLDGALHQGVAVAVGLCGDHVTLTCGTGGGWDELGPPRTATRSSGAELFEIDGQPALDLYRRYLGVEAEGLPGSGLRFPLLLRRRGEQRSALVRSVRSFDEETRAIGLTGDVPEGSVVQLLHQNSEAMVDAAQDAARAATAGAGPAHGADGALALVVSCLGRRLALGARVEDELESVTAELGAGTAVAGFYGYGELAPTSARSCDLHNQTVTVGVISEWPW
ncbi:FIST signal transduction protein [Kineococcus sp. SYSU DK001]|uniref:FIST signal transduction protein n=1 Tax=Kineococcus sp. SYSU DK001 TaxID=3383122 RepID=UPI003D7EDAFF